ncbi:helix-turn-helix transcriptional regulator [Scytonema tolypothrichoides VB-61278]|nr:helix-turn-helix transcriptional regulator [Scytonema tolypothrichoides VB-61278]
MNISGQNQCPVALTIEVIGGKWKPMILYSLLPGTKRFGDLKRLLPEVTQRMLTLQLRELEEDGIVQRTVYAEVPPRVEYSLTEFGKTLEPVLLIMVAWGNKFIEQTAKNKMAVKQTANV